MSKKYTRLVLKASIFNIICRRLPVNKDELDHREYNGAHFFTLKGLKKNSRIENPFIETFVHWIDGIKDAIDKNFLKSVYVLLKDSEDNVVESYSFNLKYNTDSKFSNKKKGGKTPEEVKCATTAMLTLISELEEIPKLSPEITLHIEFMYTDDCPMDYEPPNFASAVQPLCLKIKRPATALGKVNTGFHSLVARSSQLNKIIAAEEDLNKTDKIEDDLNSNQSKDIIEENLNKNKDVEMTDVISIDDSIASEDSNRVPKAIELNKMDSEDDTNHYLDDTLDEEELIAQLEKTGAKYNTSNVTIPDQDQTTPNIFTEDYDMETTEDIDCMCKLRIPEKLNIVKCTQCERSYHGPCVGYVSGNPGIGFKCILCKPGRKIDKEDALFHRLMLTCTLTQELGVLPIDILNFMNEKDKQNVIKAMNNVDVYQPDPSDPDDLQKGEINMEKLTAVNNELRATYLLW
ncbi:unnamed protein product [Diabrotica balteata]|uniref:HORMA domain-containing protein n=1 Tax=Diabrotica balteata TaxID=107213 RepID=A0A9N9XBK6_DIABA|nr:unnamed protein product [Diabrotica balteata]